MSIRISALHYYPVKSLKGISVEQIALDDFGFQSDRRYMLVDAKGTFVTQRKYPVLSKVSAHIEGEFLSISVPDSGVETVSQEDFSQRKATVVWQDQISAELIAKPLSGISSLLGMDIYLAHMPDNSFRQVDREFFVEDQRVSFADAFPILLTNESSLGDLNRRLVNEVPMERFRPNMVIEGAEAFAEDDWKQLRIGELIFHCVKPCSRCIMTTIDEQAKTNKEPLATLATYRKNEFGVCFGENLVHRNTGILRVGDEVEILK